MKVAFYLDNEDAALRALGRKAVAAVRQHMPKAEVIHLTSQATPAMEGVDTFLVNLCEGAFAGRRPACHALVPGECLFLDVDCILRRDVSEVFRDYAFDVALPVVHDPFVSYTGGVIFSRAPGFWHEMARRMLPSRYADTRTHLLEYQRFVDDWDGPVHRLDEFKYERLASRAEEVNGYPGASIVHYRGPRKRFLLERA